MVTVFGTVLPLVAGQVAGPSELMSLCRMPPLERLATAVDALADGDLTNRWPEFLDMYEQFLCWKEFDDIEHELEGADHKATVRKHADAVSGFLHDALTNERINPEFRRYLIL